MSFAWLNQCWKGFVAKMPEPSFTWSVENENWYRTATNQRRNGSSVVDD
jgi:hypothetical protein